MATARAQKTAASNERASESRRQRLSDGEAGQSEATTRHLEGLAREGYKMREAFAANTLGALVGAGEKGDGSPITYGGVQAYRDELVKEAGDQLEEMVREQLAFAHHQICRLHVITSRCSDSAASAAYLGAVARLMAEFRRSTLALQGYRERQQAGVGSSSSEKGAEKNSMTSELSSTDGEGDYAAA